MGAFFYTTNIVDTYCIAVVNLLCLPIYGGGYAVASCFSLEDKESLGARILGCQSFIHNPIFILILSFVKQ